MIAPQGGFILLAGVRARGIDECIELTAAIRDETDNRIIALEMRPAFLELVAGTSGWMVPNRPAELFNWANIAACPNAGLTRDLHGERYRLEVTARDRAGNEGSASVRVFPTCVEPALMEYCLDVCTIDTSASLTRTRRSP